jgi:hypothetical protein
MWSGTVGLVTRSFAIIVPELPRVPGGHRGHPGGGPGARKRPFYTPCRAGNPLVHRFPSKLEDLGAPNPFKTYGFSFETGQSEARSGPGIKN